MYLIHRADTLTLNTMDSISKQILRSPLFFPKLLIAALLVYSLVGIPLFIGYLSRFLHQLKNRRDANLPQWNSWLALLIESWELLVLITIYTVLPILLACWIASIISGWLGWLFWIPIWSLPWIPAMLVVWVAPIFSGIAYHRYLIRGSIESAFDIRSIWQTALCNAEQLLILTLVFWGVIFIGFPILGFAIAAGLTLYFPLVFQIVDQQTYS